MVERAGAHAGTELGSRLYSAKSRLVPSLLRELAPACGFAPRALAARLGVSPRHLQRLFVAELCCSPGTWLREERLQRARQLLLSSRRVKDVAYTLGFSQPAQFSRDFRARFGVAPSALIPVGRAMCACVYPCPPARSRSDDAA